MIKPRNDDAERTSLGRSEVLGFGGFVPPGSPALGRSFAYLSPSGDGDLLGTHEVTLTLTQFKGEVVANSWPIPGQG